MRGWGVDWEVGVDGKGLGEEGGREKGLNDGLRFGGVWPIDRRPRPF